MVAVTTNLLAAPAVPVAVKVTEPPTPAAVAVSVLAPAAGPRVQRPMVATPEASVVGVVPVTEPPPEATAKVTMTPETGLPPASVTLTDGAVATAAPAVATWPSPAFARSVSPLSGAVAARTAVELAVVNEAPETAANVAAAARTARVTKMRSRRRMRPRVCPCSRSRGPSPGAALPRRPRTTATRATRPL